MNRSGRVFILFFLAIAATSGYAQREKLQQSALAGSHTEGRFQLFQGSYYGNHTAQQDAVFMIDSQTGKTWIFSETVSGKTGIVTGWMALSEVEPVPREQPK